MLRALELVMLVLLLLLATLGAVLPALLPDLLLGRTASMLCWKLRRKSREILINKQFRNNFYVHAAHHVACNAA